MAEQPDQPPLASVEADLFGALFAFHQQTITLLRKSSLEDEKLKLVGERIKTLLDSVIAEMKQKQQLNLTERLEAAYEDVKRLVDELSESSGDGKEK
jgi:hypothetical protein